MKNDYYVSRPMRLLGVIAVFLIFGFEAFAQVPNTVFANNGFQFNSGLSRGMFTSGTRGVRVQASSTGVNNAAGGSLTLNAGSGGEDGGNGGNVFINPGAGDDGPDGQVFIAQSRSRVNIGPSNSGPYRFLVRPSGTLNNIAHLESGNFGDIFSTTAKWLGLGSAPAAAGASVYGKRIQWGQNFAVFNLRQNTATDKDLAIQWGGTTANSQLLFEFANSPTATPTRVMQLESNGNVGIGATPSATDRLRVNGRIRFGSAEYFEDGGSFQMTAGGTIRPDVDNSRDLGTTAFRWDDVFATNGVIQTSDRRSKRDIKTSPYGLNELMQLKPVTYKWKKDPDKGEQVGLIAQDVQKVMSEVVYDPKDDPVMDEDGNLVARENAEDLRLGISYSALIPVVIKAVQEQQAIIIDQQSTIAVQNNQINELLTAVETLKNTLAAQTTGADSDAGQGDLQEEARLIQNSPNPFTESTSVEYFLPETVQQATLYVYNMNGSLISKYELEDRGLAAYTLQAKSLTPGIYLYSIVADNQELGVKRMIITE